MIRRLIISLAMIVGALTFAVPAHGQVFEICKDTPDATVCRDGRLAPKGNTNNALFGQRGILTRAAQFLVIVVTVTAVIVIVVGGMQYVLSAGDPSKIGSAKDTIIYAIVGLVVAMTAQGIIQFVLVKL